MQNMLKSELIFVNFATNEVDKTFEIDTRNKSVRAIYLKAVTHSGLPRNAVLVQFDGSSSAVGTEGYVGFPVPTWQTNTGLGGYVLEEPLQMANVNWPGTQSVRIRLRPVEDGPSPTPITHSGISFWFILRCEPECADYDQQRTSEWHRVIGGEAGQFSGRFDYVPGPEEMAQRLASWQGGISTPLQEK